MVLPEIFTEGSPDPMAQEEKKLRTRIENFDPVLKGMLLEENWDSLSLIAERIGLPKNTPETAENPTNYFRH